MTPQPALSAVQIDAKRLAAKGLGWEDVRKELRQRYSDLGVVEAEALARWAVFGTKK